MGLQRAVRSDTMDRVKFENKGDNLKGYYIQTSEVTIDGRQVKKHVFKTAKGLTSVLGQADMYQQLKDNNCERAYVEVTFTGESKKLKGGRTMKLYNVDFDLTNTWQGDVVDTSEEVDYEDAPEETSLDSEEEPSVEDTVTQTRATKPAARPQAASPQRQAAVAALLGSKR